MYYNIYIHHDGVEDRFECDIISYKKLIDQYIKPYLKGEKILLGEFFVIKTDKDIIHIRESSISLLELHKQQKKKYNLWQKNMNSILSNRSHLYPEYIDKKPVFPDLAGLFNNDEITKDITDKIINRVQEEISIDTKNYI